MIVFNLDAKPQSKDLRFCNDYSAKIIRSAISIPLLKHNRLSQKLESALCNIEKMQKNKIILSVNEFYFEDGEKLQPSHIKNTIKYLLSEDSHSRILLSDLNKILIKNDCVVIYHKRNVKFVYALTNIKFSPFNDKGCFCGKYKIKEYEDDYIIVESNKYNSQFNTEIKFNFEENNLEDIKDYNEGKTDFTNPTTFPLSVLEENKQDMKTYENFIFFNLTFTNRQLLNPKFKDLREVIYKGAFREELVKQKYPLISESYDFLIDKDSKITIGDVEKYKEPIYLTLGYDDFYPNREVCEYLKNQLENYNIFLILKETNYYNRNTKYDLQLNLNTPDFYDNSFYYCSKYFELLTKLADGDKYKKLKKLRKRYLSTGIQLYLHEMCKTIDHLYLEIPLFIGNAVYLSKNENFNFVDLNFECFDIDKL